MPLTRLVLLSCVYFASILLPAHANLLIKVDQSNQRMIVSVNGEPRFSWPVSTGKTGYNTPNGIFRPNRMEAEHFSDEYESAPMPHAMFFDKQGHAIHGSSERLGRPASHGCVRISPGHAAELFSLVARENGEYDGRDHRRRRDHGVTGTFTGCPAARRGLTRACGKRKCVIRSTWQRYPGRRGT
jgi:hypothetical protein